MSKLNQKTATMNTIIAVLAARGISYQMGGEKPITDFLTDGDKENVRNTLFSMFRNGEIELSSEATAKYQEDSELKKYVSGLVNNWIRKAPEFNNNGKYVPKNPGSRAGSGDSQVREMKKLLTATQDAKTKSVIQSHIDARLAEIKSTKAVVSVDASKLPESLRHLVKGE
jgi:hypothetical protein